MLGTLLIYIYIYSSVVHMLIWSCSEIPVPVYAVTRACVNHAHILTAIAVSAQLIILIQIREMSNEHASEQLAAQVACDV